MLCVQFIEYVGQFVFILCECVLFYVCITVNFDWLIHFPQHKSKCLPNVVAVVAFVARRTFLAISFSHFSAVIILLSLKWIQGKRSRHIAANTHWFLGIAIFSCLCVHRMQISRKRHIKRTHQQKQQQQQTFIGCLFKRKPQQATIYDQIHFDNFFGGKCIK